MTISILKRTILFCSFITTGFIAEAQFTFAPTIGAGITGATLTAAPAVVSSSTVKTRSNSNLNETIGIGVGYQFSDYWTLNSGIFYQYIEPVFSQSTNPTTVITDKLNYINIPLSIIHTNDQLKHGWYYGIGLNFGLPVSGTDQRVTAGNPTAINNSIKFDGERNANDNYTHYNFLNLGGTATVGYFFGKIFIGADANLGFSNLTPDYNSKYKINTYGLHIGYTFNRKVVKPVVPPVDDTTTP
jgi:hypothetical protein